MRYKTIFLTKARVEFLESWIWYEDKQVGLGDRFKSEVFKAIQKIEENPQLSPVRKKPYHERRIDVFPYYVIYRINKQEKSIIIASIFHAKRDPLRKLK